MKELHLVLMAGAGRAAPCDARDSCRERASRYRRCRICRRVLARCEAHGRSLELELASCCRTAKEAEDAR